MARDGSGNYSRVEGPYVNGNVADADEINNELDDIATALTQSINTAGTKAMAAALAMGSNKITGLAAATANGDAVRYEQLTGLSATYQPLDATLTAFAGLTTADDRMLDFTGVDTMAVVTYATVLSNIGAASASLYAALASANTFTAAQTISAAIPRLIITETDQAADEQRWDVAVSLADLRFRAWSDDDLTAVTSLIAVRGTGVTVLYWEFDACDLRIEPTPTTLATNSAGFRGLPLNTQDATYAPVLGDAGGVIYHTSGSAHTWTIPANASVAYPIGTTLTFINRGAGAVTIAITSDTLNFAGSTGSRTLAQYGRATAVKITSTAWDIDGNTYLS